MPHELLIWSRLREPKQHDSDCRFRISAKVRVESGVFGYISTEIQAPVCMVWEDFEFVQ